MTTNDRKFADRNLKSAMTFVFILVAVFIWVTSMVVETNRDVSRYIPRDITSRQLETALKKQPERITSIRFEQHDDIDNITLAEYDSRNYCALIYGEMSEDPLHILVSDIIVVQDDALSNSYFIPMDKERCILKISEDTFVSQLSKELFVDISDQQIDFILSFLFRNV